MPSSGLDPSWTQVQTHAFTHAWQFGTDIVFTYGPWGFLATTLYDPATYRLLIGFWLVLALALEFRLEPADCERDGRRHVLGRAAERPDGA